MTRAATIVAAVACAMLTACQSLSTSSTEPGDCNAKLRFRGTVYAFHPDAIVSPPRPRKSEPLEPADVLDCDSDVVSTVLPRRIEGVPVSFAIAGSTVWPGVYVALGADPSTWPEALRR